jgi:hypothetical protein
LSEARYSILEEKKLIFIFFIKMQVMNGKRLVALGTLVGAGVFLGFGPKMVADEALQIPNYPFEHKKMLRALDHRA